MLDFLQSKEGFVGRLLQHLGTSAIMDMLLRLVTCMQSAECRLACVQVGTRSRFSIVNKYHGMSSLYVLIPLIGDVGVPGGTNLGTVFSICLLCA